MPGMISTINQIIVASHTKIPPPMNLNIYLNGTQRSLITGFLSSKIRKFVLIRPNHNRAQNTPVIKKTIAIIIDRVSVGVAVATSVVGLVTIVVAPGI